jgi:DNA-binding MarR family transcriptional regulator
MINEALLTAYLGSVAGVPVDATRLRENMMRFIDASYDRYRLELGGRAFLGIVVKDVRAFTPATFLKHLKVIQQKYHMDWVLIFDELPAYLASRLRSQNIPFMVPFQQLYWPYIGLILSDDDTATAVQLIDKLTPASQLAVIAALVGKIPSSTKVTELAGALEISKMSASRIANELAAAGISHDNRTGRERIIALPDDNLDLWERALPYLSSPVRQSFYVILDDLPIDHRLASGETALAQRTMLSPPRIPVFATGREVANSLHSKALPTADDDQDTCVVEKWKYDPWTTADGNLVDRFSLYLSLRDRPDERLQISLEELMEQYFDSRYRPVQNPFRRPF